MKILYVTQFYYPERAAGAFRAIDNSNIWRKENNDVTILTTYPNFPSGKVFKGYSNRIISVDKYKDIKLIRSKIFAVKNTSKLNRAISSVSFLIYSLYNMIFNSDKIGKDYDIVLGTSGTVLSPIIAYIYSRLNSIPFVLEFRDITYNQLLAVYNGKKTPIYHVVRLIELYLSKKADKIVVVTKGFKKILIRDGIQSDKIEIIPNGAIIDKGKETLVSYNNECIIFSYIGNIGGSQNLKRVIDLFDYIEIHNMKKELIIIGDGGKKEEIRDYINQRKIKNITLLDGLEYEKLDEYYKKSNFCIVSLNNNDKFIETIPSKIFTIMSKKRPILFLGPRGEASEIINKSMCGLVYHSKNYKEVAQNISEKINSYIKEDKLEQFVKECGSNGHMFVEKNYNRVFLAKKYIKVMKDTIENHSL